MTLTQLKTRPEDMLSANLEREVKLDLRFTSEKPFTSSHEAQTLALVCSDFRFDEHFFDFRRWLGRSGIDRIDFPGAQMFFLSKHYGHPDCAETAEYWTDFFAKHHLVNEILICGHAGCAAYAKAPALTSFSAEDLKLRQLQDLVTLKSWLIQTFPFLSVSPWFAEPKADKSGVHFYELAI